jgi:hypothetical protein
LLKTNQKVCIAGAFRGNKQNKCLSVNSAGIVQEEVSCLSNADETDLRIWRHCLNSSGTQKLLYSKDTDIYHIGLSLPIENNRHDIYIQQTSHLQGNSNFFSLSRFIDAIHNDPDISCIPQQHRTQAIQTIYACTGCDYISFFKGIGKVFFLNTFFQHAQFISGGSESLPGTLGDVHNGMHELGLLAFIRLVGTAYLKKHLSGFIEQKPEEIYFSLPIENKVEKHKAWLDRIRETVWRRVIKRGGGV